MALVLWKKRGRPRKEEAPAMARRRELTAMSAADLKRLLENEGLAEKTQAARVDALLAHEAQEANREALAIDDRARRKQLNVMTATDLKRLLENKGLAAAKNKAARVDAMLAHEAKEANREALAIDDAARRKQLNVLSSVDLKRLLENKGLATNRAAMVDSLLAHEAQERAESRAHEKRIRDAMVNKIAELEALGVQELGERCAAMGVRGNATKEAQVQLLLNNWQEEEGVDQVLAILAQDARKHKLQGEEPEALCQLCEELSLEPFVQEVMAERIVRKESALGRFARPVLEDLGAEEEVAAANPTTPQGGDMVEALLARETPEKEPRGQQEEEEAKKREALESMTLRDLKARITARGREALGKKADLVEILLEIAEQDEAAEARKAKVKAMPVEELKQLCEALGVSPFVKEIMVERIVLREVELSATKLAAKRART